ncbi:unnamed protein product [Cuscuta epithymum]|uniref:Uncharacterized protein n=1 Tax=Cuscuta epithymum TaxID=186058 RepID=A0AAV0DHL6_9ASTE|nr:unnamed protein product [Cuscuta epithymum]
MPAVRQHPEHLRILVLAQAYGTQAVVSRIRAPLRVHEFRVRIDHRLIEPDGAALRRGAVVLLGGEDYAGEVDPVLVGVGVAAAGLCIAAAAADGGGAAADVGGQKDGGEEDEEAEGDGDGVAEADGGDVGGDGVGGRRRRQGRRQRRRRGGGRRRGRGGGHWERAGRAKWSI